MVAAGDAVEPKEIPMSKQNRNANHITFQQPRKAAATAKPKQRAKQQNSRLPRGRQSAGNNDP